MPNNLAAVDDNDDLPTKAYVDSGLSGKSDTSHLHDTRYYTESEVDSLLAGKASSSHNHASTYVDTSGDTMTGFLTLSASPTDSLHAATKGYVDAEVSGGGSRVHVGTAQGDGTGTLGPITIASSLWTDGFRNLSIEGYLDHDQGANFVDCHMRINGLTSGHRMQRTVWVGTGAPASGTFGGLGGWIFYAGLRSTVRALIPGFGDADTTPTAEITSFSNIGTAAASFRRTVIGGWHETAGAVTDVRLLLVSGGFTSDTYLSVHAYA